MKELIQNDINAFKIMWPYILLGILLVVGFVLIMIVAKVISKSRSFNNKIEKEHTLIENSHHVVEQLLKKEPSVLTENGFTSTKDFKK